MDEEEIRVNIYGGYEKYRDCVKEEGLKVITVDIRWEWIWNGNLPCSDKTESGTVTVKQILRRMLKGTVHQNNAPCR